jgi:hypothetical protein
MKRSLLHKLLVLLFCVGKQAAAQLPSHGLYQTELDTPAVSSFYKINLLPALVAKCSRDLHDIRIIENATGQQIPYILKSDSAVFRENKFINFPILSVKREKDKQTHVIIRSDSTKLVNEFLLFIKNTDAARTISLSGSNNQRDWFIIKEDIYLDDYFNQLGDQFIQILSFPPSKYAFFKLSFVGKDLLPANIVRAGSYTGQTIAIKSITQKDSSDKNSYITLLLDAPYLINKLTVEVEGPRYFKRILEVIVRTPDEGTHIIVFSLSSGGKSSFSLPKNIKTDRLLLRIRNDDNLPLKVTAASCWQINQYLLTYLEATKKYRLQFSDSIATDPVYDLSFFKDSIPAILPQLTYSNIKETNFNQPVLKSTGFSKVWMWLAIIVAGLVLLTFTMQLTRQINKKNT